jgi:PKD repeat protein
MFNSLKHILFFNLILFCVISLYSQNNTSDYIPTQLISYGLDAPGRMAIDSDDNIYVIDAIQKSIIKYNIQGDFISSIDSNLIPLSIAINKNDQIFVADKYSGDIYALHANGSHTLFYSGLSFPASMVFGSNDILYIVDSKQKKVIGLDVSGNVIKDFTYSSFTYPTGIAYDAQNNHIIVSEHGGIGEDVQYCYSGSWSVSSWGPVTSIYIFDLESNLINQFGCFGTKNGEFQRIQGIKVGTCGNIYATDPYLGRVSVFDANGNYITKFGTQGNGPGEFNIPTDIVFSKDNRAFISSMNKGAIDIFSITDTLPTASITSEDQTICANAAGTIEINFTGNGPWSFNYTLDKLNPVSVTANESPFNFEVTEAGIYEVTAVTDSNNVEGTCFTGSTSINVIDPPTATILTSDFSKCQDENLGVEVQFTGTAPWVITYTIDGLNPTELMATENSFTIPTEQSGVYEIIKLSDAYCTGDTFAGNSSVTIYPLPTASLVNEFRYVQTNPGEVTDFVIALTGTAPWTITILKDEIEEYTFETSDSLYTFSISEESTYEIMSIADLYCANNNWQCFFNLTFNDIELPTATIASTNIEICAGASKDIAIEFTGTAPWTFTYTVDGVNPSGISTSANPYVLSASLPGVYELSAVSDVNGDGTFSGLTTVSVFDQPILDLGTDIHICEGETRVLDAGIFEWYEWSDGTTAQTLEVSTAGIYSVTVTDVNGCTATASVTVTVEPVPFVDLGPDINLCEGDPVYVLDAGNFETYLWSDGSTGRTLEVSAVGIYSVTVTNTSGCTASDTVSAMVLSLPDAYFYYDVNALEVQFVNEAINADAHYWDFGDGNSSTEENPIHNYASKGSYTVTYTALSTYCGSSAFTETVNVGGKSTSELIDIYPNPSTGKFTILISPNEPLLGTINILIHSTSGQYLYSGTYNPNTVTSYNGNYYIDVNIDRFTKGIYIVYINAGNFVGQDKLILKD